MQTILGPFHPDLENAFADEILACKTTDLLSPLLVLTPSDSLRRRLKFFLVRERGLSLLNLQLLTFHQLALRLREESNGTPYDMQRDLFFEEALRQLIRSRCPGAEPFVGLEERTGGCAALWQTLRDLRDGSVDPTVALDALAEGHFGPTAERTSALLHLLHSFQHFCGEQNVTGESDLNLSATERVPSSKYLKQFSRVFYYGFYDLTQIQLDFFHAVARHFPTTLFFPLLAANPSHDAWRFAERFYERYVEGHSDSSAQKLYSASVLPAHARLFDTARNRSFAAFPNDWRCQITSAFGIHDEIATAAKQILEQLDRGNIQFHEIGVVARSLESYAPIIKTIFDQHCISVSGRVEEPLAQAPLTKAVILLLNLPAKDFLRSHIIDLLSSPYFQFQNIHPHPASVRPDLWDLATRELAICKGIGEWRRLRRYGHRDLELRQVSDDEAPRKIRIRSSDLICLADTVESLIADLLSLPVEASWREYTAAWKLFLNKYLGLAEGTETPPGTPLKPDQTILEVLNELAGLDRVKDSVTLGDFVHTFQHWLERSSIIDDRRNIDGVTVLNATAARGLSFRVLFVLGINEGVFPRAIREDAFLRDRDREVLERDLGYKVSQKLTAFDEEKLLFTLLIGAARERLYCSFQRADENGRALAPSWYLDELKRALEESHRPCETVDIPRSLTEKAATAPYQREDLLLPTEWAIRLSLQGRDPTPLIEACAPLPAIYRQGKKVAAEIDRSGDRLLAYDGALTDFQNYWERYCERGVSPTALENYARCPFQFFARHVLGLAPLDRPEEVLGPSPAEFGELGHGILHSFYAALIEAHYFTNPRAPVDVDHELQIAANQAFTEYQENHPIGYPLAWEILKKDILELLRKVVTQDLSELQASGFAPMSLENNLSTQLPADWPEPLNHLLIRGRLDRIDCKDDAVRVIDYKFKFGATPATQDKNLIRAALRGERLQPPFYYMLAQHWTKARRQRAAPGIEANFFYIAPRWLEGPLISKSYGGEALIGNTGAETKRTIAYLAAGVRSGQFFINRGEYCGQCDAAPICRKNHPPSLWRAAKDPITEPHRALRQKNFEIDEHDPECE
jgi:ATP-dependent helicase/nuclease subunit B